MYHPFRLLVRCMLVCMSALLLTSCYYSHPNQTDHWAEASEGAVDSVSFYISHHYWIGYNFQTTDSLQLSPLPPQIGVADYAISPQRMPQVRKHDDLVVARIQYVPADTVDSVWVKVARDQLTQGWVRESVLLAKVVPNDPISKFIYHFSGRTTGFVLLFLGLAVLFGLIQAFRHKHYRMVHFRDIPSFYPTLLCLTVSASAALYGSIQCFVPSTWVEYYYYPTLNPLNINLPLIMSLFLASVWCILIVAVAVVDEIRRQPDLGDNLAYLASLGGVCVVLYLVFTLTTPLYIGYPLLLAYWYFAIRQYWLHQPSHLLCGVCCRSIPRKGRCPHCGAMNE